jgi:uncharacterized protein with PIN domain
MKEELILKYWEGVSECNCDSPHPIGSCLKCDMQNLIMSESRKKHPLTTKEDAEKQVAEFDKAQPTHSGSRCPDCEGVLLYVSANEHVDEHLQCDYCNGTFNKGSSEEVLHESHIEMQVPFDKRMRELVESRAKHPLTTKEEAEKQVAEFDKVQPINKAWREMRDVDAIVEERDALLSENERLNNIIIELDRIIDLNEQQLCAEERDALKAKVESIEKVMLNDDDLDIFTVWDELERILEL